MNKLTYKEQVIFTFICRILNLLCFFVGMAMVWQTTHNGWAVFWTFIASLHFSIKK